jgi:hypothetical protein
MKTSNSNALSIFNYEGAKITFQTTEGHVMVNANEMAKPFGKLPTDFLKTKQTKDYITILGQYENIHTEKLVEVQNGGSNPGTWLHELIALRFAQWLSPHFSIWVDKHIKELLTKGKTEKPKQIRRTALPASFETWDKMYDCFHIYCKRYPSRKEYLFGFDKTATTLQDLETAREILQDLINQFK